MQTDDILDSMLAPSAPEGVVCELCGERFPATWWEPRPEWKARGMTGKWCKPPNPCRDCEAEEHRAALKRAEKRARAVAGVSPRYQGFDLSRAVLQHEREDPEVFVRRMKARRNTIGVLRGNQPIVRLLREWEPAHRSVYLQGAVGRGKTLLLSAFVNRLTAVEEMILVPGTDKTPGPATYTRPARYHALYIDERELMRRTELSWKGDPVPLFQVSRVPVLVLDELGCTVEGSKSKKALSMITDAIERLVDYRYRNELPIVIGSNHDFHDLPDILGHRTASRLSEMVETRKTIVGPDWRGI